MQLANSVALNDNLKRQNSTLANIERTTLSRGVLSEQDDPAEIASNEEE